MTTVTAAAKVPSPAPAANKPHRTLQRQCECGSYPGRGGGECTKCGGRRASRIQPKLLIGAVHDPLESEADRVADAVMAMSPAGAGPAFPGASALPAIQRAKISEAGPSAGEAPAIVDDVLRSPGQTLDGAARRFFEPRFGHDLSRVRIHADATAARSAAAIDARAYTVGHDVVFGQGMYAPRTEAGRRLLAHELTHVAQQTGGNAAVQPSRILRATACGHDGKGTGCGGALGKIKFADETLALDRTVVEKGLKRYFPGKWLSEVATPANPTKSGQDGGRVDGLRATQKDGLEIEVVEIKPRALGVNSAGGTTGGCAQATTEAMGYVAELNKLAPKIKVLSEKLSKIGGFRIDGKLTPTTKTELGIFQTVGINIGDDDWLNAWKFYNSLQQKWPIVFTKPFASVSFGLFAEGEAGKGYDAYGWLVKCDNDEEGVETLGFMVNKEGGVSYGCEKSCGKKEKKKKPQAKEGAKPKEAPVRVGVTTPGKRNPLELVGLDPEIHELQPQVEHFLGRMRVYTPENTRYLIIAPKNFYMPLIANPRMERTLELMRTHAMDPSRNPVLGLRALGWTLTGLYAGSMVVVLYGPMIYALKVGAIGAAVGAMPAIEAGSGIAATGVAATGVGTGTGTAAGLTVVTGIGDGAALAANTNAVRELAVAAGVMFIVATTKQANAAEVSDVDGVRVVPMSETAIVDDTEIRPGTQVEYNGKKYYVIGGAKTSGGAK